MKCVSSWAGLSPSKMEEKSRRSENSTVSSRVSRRARAARVVLDGGPLMMAGRCHEFAEGHVHMPPRGLKSLARHSAHSADAIGEREIERLGKAASTSRPARSKARNDAANSATIAPIAASAENKGATVGSSAAMMTKAAPADDEAQGRSPESGCDSSALGQQRFATPANPSLDAGTVGCNGVARGIAEADRRGADEEDAPLDRLARRAPLQHRRRPSTPLRRLGAIARTDIRPGADGDLECAHLEPH